MLGTPAQVLVPRAQADAARQVRTAVQTGQAVLEGAEKLAKVAKTVGEIELSK